MFKNASEEIMCRVFSIYLEGKARAWYKKLAPGSIDSFEKLAKKFMIRFWKRKKFTKTMADLMKIKQGRDKTIQVYLDSFIDESLQVED